MMYKIHQKSILNLGSAIFLAGYKMYSDWLETGERKRENKGVLHTKIV